MKPVHYSASAEAELAEALDWYAREHPEHVRPFAQGVDDALASIRSAPAARPLAQVDGLPAGAPEVRAARVAAFSYRLVYFEREHDILVIAVAHTSLPPGYWVERVPRS